MKFTDWELGEPNNAKPIFASDWIGFGGVSLTPMDPLDKPIAYKIDPRPRTFTAETDAPIKLGDRVKFRGHAFGIAKIEGKRFWAIEVELTPSPTR